MIMHSHEDYYVTNPKLWVLNKKESEWLARPIFRSMHSFKLQLTGQIALLRLSFFAEQKL